MDNFAIICAYNEEKTAVDVTRKTLKYVDKIIFVNDGSTDRTLNLMQSGFKGEKRVIILSHKKNMGKGRALMTGFKRFLDEGGKNAVTIDADGQSDPEEIPNLLLLAENRISDIVVGSRFTKERGKIPLMRVLLNIFVNLLMVLVSGSFYSDLSSGFRCYTRKVVEGMLPELRIEGYGIEADSLRIASMKGFSVAVIPVSVSYNTGKKTNLVRMARSYTEFVWKYKSDIVKRIFNRKV
ncbi:hypothetical protein A3K63_00905 [Candidatus Micrarchaeota archaeon RBG_16_49_10]|nr:MAG: hypothetical protein A3K63_00905 [Candidatus Micrarchaeota archaeon RBG_16_49_10]